MEATKSEKLVEVSFKSNEKRGIIIWMMFFFLIIIACCFDIHHFYNRLIDIVLVL